MSRRVCGVGNCEIEMAAIESYRDLESWKVSVELAVEAFSFASHLPQSERFEMGSQLRKAAVSIPSNIAEGQASGPGRRYHHVEIVRRRQILSTDAFARIDQLAEHAGRLIHGLERSVRWRSRLPLGA
jgi:hypothetical protein